MVGDEVAAHVAHRQRLRPSARIDKLAGKGFGVEVAKERVDLLDVDRLFLLIDAPARKKLSGDELFNRLAVAREDRVIDLPYAGGTQLGAAVAFNSVLSIPFALDGIGRSLKTRRLGYPHPRWTCRDPATTAPP